MHIKKKGWDSRKGTALLRGDSCVQDSGGTHKNSIKFKITLLRKKVVYVKVQSIISVNYLLKTQVFSTEHEIEIFN